jgi:hypothetical protein
MSQPRENAFRCKRKGKISPLDKILGESAVELFVFVKLISYLELNYQLLIGREHKKKTFKFLEGPLGPKNTIFCKFSESNVSG